MKAVVVEIKDCAASVLTDEGRVVRVKNHNYRVGQVIFMKQSMNRKIRFGAVAAAAACVMLLFGGGAYAYYSPASYVSLDVNPSIEYVLNRFDRVLTVIGVNEDGQKFLKKIELEQLGNKKIEDAIAQTVKQLKEDGYFSGEDGGIVISASAKDLKKAEMLAKNLKTDADKAVDDENVTVEAFADGWNRVQEAQELGVTPGKLNLVEKLQDITGDAEKIDVEDWLKKPVKEIMSEIKANRKEQKAEQQEEKTEEKKRDTVSSEESKPESAESKPVKPDAESKTESCVESKQEKTESRVEEKQEKQEEKAESKAEKEKVKEEKSENSAKDKEKSNQKPASAKGGA